MLRSFYMGKRKTVETEQGATQTQSILAGWVAARACVPVCVHGGCVVVNSCLMALLDFFLLLFVCAMSTTKQQHTAFIHNGTIQ